MTTRGYSPTSTSAPTEAPRGAYGAPTAQSPLSVTIPVPGSKSLTNRELILAALADGPGRVESPLHSQDAHRMGDALRALGVGVERVPGKSPFGDDLVITPRKTLTGGCTIDSGQAGTVMRFVAPLLGLADGEVHMTADENALHRPMGAMIKALRDLGVDIDDGGNWSLPFTVYGRGHIRGGELEIDASASSQFVSGLLLAAPRFDVGLHLKHTGKRLPSLPHIEMTVEALARRGVHVERPTSTEWIVPATTPRAKTISIEPDLSNAAPFLAAAMIAGGSVTIPGWPPHSTQPGAQLTDILSLLGGKVSRRGGAVTVSAGQTIHGVDLDLSAVSELTPTLVGLAAFADGPSSFTGIGHIRQHETDRIAGLVNGLRELGCGAEELPDGIRVIPQAMHGGTWKSHHDHRMATTGALIGLGVPGVTIDDIGTTAKTMPQFVWLWQKMLAGE
ncbi:3-phosphoshikimate 1-carboxyvinyltransferase [Microbacterium amylolyticum]|uniref:3-phosphoshikimate 1-carboxyvinyltransferase n=1 Tax=Microbacterium amylolyticum TaxID=936337 RepID=A0ABS4ZI00_9MICO|nr:3-phosphoshikimate 1-carboxyvinyltransferase [Microbacterium amylolyticum]MBP2436904.1 3-phosphoshikimate 1-carboxyvinyltransferase [Microbacterium amylolyticum]